MKKNESIYKNIVSTSEDYAKETLKIVDEKSTKLMDDLDEFRSRVNTDVNMKFTDEVKTSTTEIESKLNSLSVTTNDQTINISDNITNFILDI